jgi:hypothetical protein
MEDCLCPLGRRRETNGSQEGMALIQLAIGVLEQSKH